MGEVYSTPGSNSNQGQSNSSAGNSQGQRTRETGASGSQNTGVDHLTLDAISRLQSGNAQLPPGSGHSVNRTTTPVEHLFSSNIRGSRNQEPPSTNVHPSMVKFFKL